MTNQIIIIGLLIALIYLYYQNRKKSSFLTGNSSDPDYQQQVSETIANLKEENEDLITEKDQAIRDKNEAEQEVLSLSNKLKLKQQEVSNKDKEVQRLKDEKTETEISLNEKIKELKTKYSKQAQLLDEEQTDNNKLNQKIEQLENQITELTRPKSPMPGEFPENKNSQEPYPGYLEDK